MEEEAVRAALRHRLDRRLCSGGDGRLRWEPDGVPPFWRRRSRWRWLTSPPPTVPPDAPPRFRCPGCGMPLAAEGPCGVCGAAPGEVDSRSEPRGRP